MKKLFIFDWSGTLSDNFHSFSQVCAFMFEELGREPISDDELRKNFTLPYMEFWNAYFPDLSQEEQCEMYEKYIHQVDDPEIFNGVADVLKNLKSSGFGVSILSSDPVSKLIPEIATSGLSPYIDDIIGNIHHKDVEIAELVKQSSILPKDSYYIGDTSGDVEAGKSAGVKTIGISWGFQHRDVLQKSQPDYLIDDIVQVLGLI